MKSILTLTACLLTLGISAQTKLTKTNIVGKWAVNAIEMQDIFYYNVDKDSLAIGSMLKEQMKDTMQLSIIKNALKSQTGVFSKMFFQFNADGTAVMNSGVEPATSTSYSVDEENSTIINTGKDGKEPMKGDMLDGHLRIFVEQPQGNMTLIFRKQQS